MKWFTSKKTINKKVETTIIEKIDMLNCTGRQVVITHKSTTTHTTTHTIGYIVEHDNHTITTHDNKHIAVNTIKAIDYKAN